MKQNLIALARVVNTFTDAELATISRGEPLEALMEAMRARLSDHPDVETALTRLEGLAAGRYDGMAQMSAGDESARHGLRH